MCRGVDAMNTVPRDDAGSAPFGVPAVSPSRRLVAVAVTEADAVHAGSDLRHVAGAASEVDVLIVRRDPPGLHPVGDTPMDAEDYPDDGADADGPDADGADRAAPVAEVAEVAPRIRLHRLGLRWSVQDRDEPDLVAAMSELVGFDPDHGVSCVAPSTTAEPVGDPELAVVARAVRRVARVYGLPVLSYRRWDGRDDPARELTARELSVSPAVCGTAG